MGAEDERKMARRGLMFGGGAALATLARGNALANAHIETPDMSRRSSSPAPGVTLLNAPIELAGDWGGMIPASADKVIEAMRHACLDGVRLMSDRQPARLRVDEHRSGPPSVWLHPDGSTTAWVIIDIGERAWCQLAYQFGHELGHVLANSWQASSTPGGPCQWLEEALVEASSLRGLGVLARNWRRAPPFPADNAYADAIADYRRGVVEDNARLGAQQGGLEAPAAWFARHRPQIEGGGGLNPFAKAFTALVLTEYERAPDALEALGALNRWPARTALPLPDYLRAWEASCAELSASPALPAWLQTTLRPR
jgi:hypothetical protein